MVESGKQTGRHYEALKQRLWNQPRALKFLEWLKSHGASIAMLEDFARRFAAGQHGEAEIRAAVCCEILRNSNPKAILKRITDLHSVHARVLLDLSHIAAEIGQFKSWDVHQEMGFEDWTEFSEKVLGISDNIADTLLLARKQVSGMNLNHFLQVMIKGYVVPAILPGEQSLAVEELLERERDPEVIIQKLKVRLERAEFKNGELIRAIKALEEELIRTRAEKYREVQKREAMIDKLTRNMDTQGVKPSDSPTPEAKNVRPKMIRKEHHPQAAKIRTRKKKK